MEISIQARGRARLADDAATAVVGAALGRSLRGGDAVLLFGPLGAGKTVLARAAIRARAGAGEDVPSPTFTLVQSYSAAPEVLHVDLYRLSGPDEVLELGVVDAFATSIVFVEWPERLGDLRPDRRLEIRLSHMDEDDGRFMEWRALGGGWDHALFAIGSAV